MITIGLRHHLTLLSNPDPLISSVWSLALTFQIRAFKKAISVLRLRILRWFQSSSFMPRANLILVTNTSRFTDVTWRISNEGFQMKHFKVKPVPWYTLLVNSINQLSLFQLNARYPPSHCLYDEKAYGTRQELLLRPIPFDLAYSMTSFKAQVAPST
jgi:hypothetical protein